MTESLKRTEYYYDTDNALQNVAVWEFPEEEKATESPATKKYWLIFIHGGAWRDPRATFDEAEPTINALLSRRDPDADKDASPSPPLSSSSRSIAGFASINYRLSPHPSYAQDQGTTPSFAGRNARHPDHLHDVLSALRLLQRTLGFGDDGYVLFGHSAGAFLSYQVLLSGSGSGPGPDSGVGGKEEDDHDAAVDHDDDSLGMPAAVVGFEGIYDLVGLDARMGGGYASFMEAAFGTDRGHWAGASPATAPGSFGVWSGRGAGAGAGRKRLAVLAHSPDDELVDLAEVDAMEGRLRADGVGNVLVFRDLKGGHFEVCNDGSFARVLVRTLGELERLDRA